MDKVFRFKNSAALIFTLTVGMLGFICALQDAVSLIRGPFDTLVFAVDILYMLAFFLLFIYGLKFSNSSRGFFRTIIVTDALIVLVTGVLFPYEASTLAITKVIQLMSLSAYGGLIIFLFNWKNTRNGLKIFLFICVAEILISIYGTCVATLYSENDFLMVTYLWLRPILAASITVCYLVRMKEKSEEQNIG